MANLQQVRQGADRAGLCRKREMRHIGHMGEKPPKDDRKERLAKQLRANLARRKAQARAKRAGEADERPDGLKGAGDGAPAKDEGGKA